MTTQAAKTVADFVSSDRASRSPQQHWRPREESARMPGTSQARDRGQIFWRGPEVFERSLRYRNRRQSATSLADAPGFPEAARYAHALPRPDDGRQSDRFASNADPKYSL